MYFCKNCGEPYMTDEAVMCVKCGVAKGQGNNYCHNCGKPLAPDAAVCLNCGVANKQAPAPDAKSKLVAGLLAIFLGTFGVHNFYLGYTGKAVTQLVLSIVGILLCCVVVGVFIVMLNSHPSFPFCKRVSHFESDLQILYPTFHFCNDFPVFSLAFMI